MNKVISKQLLLILFRLLIVFPAFSHGNPSTCIAVTKQFSHIKKHDIIMNSPDHRIGVKFQLSRGRHQAQFCVYYRGREVLDTSLMGLLVGRNETLGENVTISAVKRSEFSKVWRPLYGERDQYTNHYNQTVILLKDRKSGKASLVITFRCYNEGVAFRYTVPENDPHKVSVVTGELTRYVFPRSVKCWVSYSAQGEIHELPVDSFRAACERPLLVKEDTDTYIILGEAAVVNFARMKYVRSHKDKYTIQSLLDGEVIKEGAFSTPWRYIMVSERPGDLLAHDYLSLNLNKPDQLKDASWIKPGKVLREVTLTTQGGLACIDFAAAHHFQYIEFDAGWYGAENSDTSDATRVAVDPARSKGPLDLQKVIRYGESRGIGIILYVNRFALERQLDTLLPLYESWGIKGVKFGFVNVGTQKANIWLMAAVRKAARYHLMVDIHDEYRPTGYSRTYPDLMTQEGVRGDEESPPNDMVLNTLFTRMIAGAADQTNCYFGPRIAEMGSHVSQMAKTICIYSPFQFLFWYDRPKGSPGGRDMGSAGKITTVIKETPELKFFDRLPTIWDNTRILSGYPGEYISVARRKGNDWYIGCLTGKAGRKFSINLSFLRRSTSYKAIVYYDSTLQTLTKVGIKKMIVNRNSIISRDVLPENGLVICLKPDM